MVRQPRDPSDPKFRHGTVNNVAKCKCESCLAARAAYARKRRKLKAQGKLLPGQLVSATKCRYHLRNLVNQGYTLERLAAAYGLHSNTLADIYAERRDHVTRVTEHKILYYDVTLMGEQKSFGRIAAAPYREHCRRLFANGWNQRLLGELAGMKGKQSLNVFRDRAIWLQPKSVKLLDQLFAQIGDTPGPDDWSREYWRNRGWLPPIGYDDDDLPDWTAVAGLTPRQKLAVQRRKRELVRERKRLEEDEFGVAS
jgi:hypothetical protein